MAIHFTRANAVTPFTARGGATEIVPAAVAAPFAVAAAAFVAVPPAAPKPAAAPLTPSAARARSAAPSLGASDAAERRSARENWLFVSLPSFFISYRLPACDAGDFPRVPRR